MNFGTKTATSGIRFEYAGTLSEETVARIMHLILLEVGGAGQSASAAGAKPTA
ncbi:hypothetical protein [Paraburkholderia sp. UCT31]|uniref:hypothetical protein n=1 Tax=Paraburkholderia sp. UCT31 TaxID=2615209 RepID=UPI00165571FE|nr:hypothetical protein [Paraburkholderia sp. UCT31]